MRLKSAYALSLLFLAAACASPQQRAEPSDYLATRIDSDGTKEFYYTISLASRQRPAPAPPAAVGGGAHVTGGSSGHLYGGVGISLGAPVGRQRRGGATGPVQEAFIREHLEKKLLVSGYCRQGWLERDRNVQPPDLMSIHGVCKETATARDRRQFPNEPGSGG